MARLTKDQWEKARAEYEVRGISLREIGRRYGISDMAVGKRSKKEGWIQGKSLHLVDKKVAAVKALAEVEAESLHLPQTQKFAIEDVAKECLQADGILARSDIVLALKIIEIAGTVTSPEDIETLARARKNLAPQVPKEGTTVNVTQQQAQGTQILSPKDALAEIVAEAREDNPLEE